MSVLSKDNGNRHGHQDSILLQVNQIQHRCGDKTLSIAAVRSLVKVNPLAAVEKALFGEF